MEVGFETEFWSDLMGLMATSLNVGHDDPMPLLWTTSADSTLLASCLILALGSRMSSPTTTTTTTGRVGIYVNSTSVQGSGRAKGSG